MGAEGFVFEQVVNPAPAFFAEYERLPMLVYVNSKLEVNKIDKGLGGILLREVSVNPYVKDLGQYEPPTEFPKKFNIGNWGFFAAYHQGTLIGAATVVYQTKEVIMLGGRDDLCVLWDIRVDDQYKRRGIGSGLFQMAVTWAKEKGIRQMKIECQNNNVPAVRFYHKHGAVLRAVDEYFYYDDPDSREEVALFWYLDLQSDPVVT